jgi:peptide/nickel transport system substrate-binding protein
MRLAGSLGFVPSPTAVESAGADYPRHPVGTGPFNVAEFEPGHHITVVRNPNYWRTEGDRKLPYLDAIVYTFTSDSKVRLQRLEAGDIDIIQSRDSSIIKQAIEAGLKVQKISGSSSSLIVFNTTRAPLDDVRVRRALAQSVEKQRFSDLIWAGTRPPSNSVFARDSQYYLEGVGDPPFDPPAAERLIQDYGKPVKLTLECISCDPQSTDGLPLLQEMWRAIGVDVALKFTDQAAFVTDKLGARDFEAACWSSSQFADPDSLYASYHSGGRENVTNLSDSIIDAALEAGRRTAEFAVRKAAYDSLQRQLANVVPFVNIAYDLYTNIFRQDVHGVPRPQANSLGAISPTTLWLSRQV